MKIIWSEPAIKDLDNLKLYIAQDSKQYALIFINKIIKTTEEILNFPEIGRIVPERNNKSIREIVFQHYRIIYKISKGVIYILTVCHSSRDLSGWKEK